MARPTATADDLSQGLGEPDPHEPIDPLGEIGIESEERLTAEERELETVDVLEGLRSMQGADPIRWNITRVGDPDQTKNGFLAQWMTSQLTQERIRDEFGGGTYRVRGLFSNGRYAAQRTVVIAGDAQPSRKMNAPQGGGFDMAQFFAMMDARDRQARRESQDREQANEAREERSRKSRLEMLTVLGPLVAPMGTALITAMVGRAPAASVDPMQSLKAMAETLATLQGLTGGGGNDSGDTLVELVKAVAPHAGPVLASLAARPPAPVAAITHRPAPGSQPTPPMTVNVRPNPAPAPVAPVQSAPVPVTPGHSGVDLNAPTQNLTDVQRAMFAELKPQVDQLVMMAQQGADPLVTADVFFDSVMSQMNENLYSSVAEFILHPQALTRIAIFNTGVKTNAAFFEAFKNRVCERITAEDQAAQNG